MSFVARNALKGYVYQNYVFALFLAKMDAERQIFKITSEAIATAQFDDLFIECEETSYHIQIKNYADTTIDDIHISENTLSIKGNVNKYSPTDNNILIVNTSSIETNTKFMDFDALVIKGITIVPLTETQIGHYLDRIFRSTAREMQIVQMAQQLIAKARFVVEIKDLPELIRLSTDLEHNTIMIREPQPLHEGITYIVGKPGVGKSHYVNELISEYPKAVVYRFWTNAQDENLKSRLLFDHFIEDLALGVFGMPKNFELEELIAEINDKKLTIIIDGLDHVENYNAYELLKYIEFINSLSPATVVVLSRPLKQNISWRKIELGNWTYDESSVYLAEAHNITDFDVLQSIFAIADGYPIITSFLAEHYSLYGELNIDHQITSINQYYNLLLENVNMRTHLTLFATNNSFFLESELESLLDSKEMSQMVKDFINCYPYLFKRIINRVSLIHDSFNTYLRTQLPFYEERRRIVTEKVKNSLMAGEIEYMARLSSFDFLEDFFDDLLKKYSDGSFFENLLQITLDYNSIADFYNQLQLILEKRRNVLNIYQYYSFVLIHQIVNRNNLICFEGLIYQILLYMKNRSCVEEQIFSTGAMWNLYVLLVSKDRTEYERYLNHQYYDPSRLDDVLVTLQNDISFFDQRAERFEYTDMVEVLEDTQKSALDKRDAISRYLISVWVNNEHNAFYDILTEYINCDKNLAENHLIIALNPFNIEKIWIRSALSSAKYQLHEVGLFGDENIFRNSTLKDFILKCAPKGSFDTMESVHSFLRLVNKEKVSTDIYSVNYAWAMYYMRKDYSIYSLVTALLVFEKHGLICEDESLKIIEQSMRRSEKGIRHLMTSYINSKPLDFIKALINRSFFEEDHSVRIEDLSSQHISCFEPFFIENVIRHLLGHYSTSRKIEYCEVRNILHSRHQKMMLSFLSYNGFTVYNGSDDFEVRTLFESNGINYIVQIQDHTEETEYIPFKYGCIHEEDADYIIANGLSHIEISKYADGWHSCFPFPQLYLFYDQNAVKKDYLTIIHNAIFAKVPSVQHIGNWSLLLGNIIKFLDQSNIELDWERIYSIFRWFLACSLIYDDH